ncbi:MAG: sigma-70 family RNA polymerase sigma factor [Pseudomonadota bacterium]
MTTTAEHSSDGLTGEARLVARIADRDEAAFRAVIGEHARLLHRIAYRMMGDAHEAEDIAQEAMLRLWDHAPRLSARGGSAGVRLAPWLKRVAINLAIDRLRVTKRSSDSEVPDRADEAPLADAQIEADEQGAAARSLIAKLPDRQRAAIVLTYYEELSNADAADALDMNIKAFESLLRRARVALRKAFGEREAEGERYGRP